jgi:hypothetical protein
MSRWILLNLNKGKIGDKQVISEKNLKKIHSPQMVTGGSLSKDKEFLYTSYGMGWSIRSYRGHPLVEHGGGIDGFVSHVSLFPRNNAGIVVLTNSSTGGNRFCSVITYNVLDRILRLPRIPWSQQFKKRNEETKKKAEKEKKEGDRDRKPNTKPSHNLEDYIGEYENPGYGILSIKKDGDQLIAIFNGLQLKVRHYHYDIFEFTVKELGDAKLKVHFYIDVKGNISRVSVPFQEGVKNIEFTRVSEKKNI